MVSAGDFWPSQQELSRYLKYMARARIPEFESDMPSQPVRSPLRKKRNPLEMPRTAAAQPAGQATEFFENEAKVFGQQSARDA
jgi:hypothetical protein